MRWEEHQGERNTRITIKLMIENLRAKYMFWPVPTYIQTSPRYRFFTSKIDILSSTRIVLTVMCWVRLEICNSSSIRLILILTCIYCGTHRNSIVVYIQNYLGRGFRLCMQFPRGKPEAEPMPQRARASMDSNGPYPVWCPQILQEKSFHSELLSNEIYNTV